MCEVGQDQTDARVRSRQLVCCVVIGPLSFGIKAWFRIYKLGRNCGFLDRMIAKDHVFV